MARSRNIKPSFFTNELLPEIDPLGRLLFIGMWCIADREGRLEDRPKRIKIEILPSDNCDVDRLLDALQIRGFIKRYEVAGARFIQVTNFTKHQSPHFREGASRIPAPEQPSAVPGQASGLSGASPSGAALIPDSGFLIPEKTHMSGKKPPDVAAQPEAEHAGSKAECVALLDYLNAKTGKKFRPVEANIRLLAARLKEATAEEIRAVIDDRVSAWKGDAKMSAYLRPETLFNATKFAGYLGQLGGTSNAPAWWERAGFATEGEAADAGCWQSNWREFQDGQRVEVTA